MAQRKMSKQVLNDLYLALMEWLKELDLVIKIGDGQYGSAETKNGKRIVNFNCDDKVSFVCFFGIREDGNTRTVFNGVVRTLNEAKLIWELTL
jgi:hypothetical protein